MRQPRKPKWECSECDQQVSHDGPELMGEAWACADCGQPQHNEDHALAHAERTGHMAEWAAKTREFRQKQGA